MKAFHSFFSVLLLLCAWAGRVQGENWPQFRGPGARGVAEDPKLPNRWSTTENVRWKTTVPGRGWSCPIVWGDKLFVTTVASKAESEAPKNTASLLVRFPVPCGPKAPFF